MAHVATLASAYLGGSSSYESKEDHTYPEYAANRCVCGCLWKIQKDVRTILVDQPPLTSKGMWHTIRDRVQRIYLVVLDAELISSAYLLDVDFLVASDQARNCLIDNFL
jgi:hypothetical protein